MNKQRHTLQICLPDSPSFLRSFRLRVFRLLQSQSSPSFFFFDVNCLQLFESRATLRLSKQRVSFLAFQTALFSPLSLYISCTERARLSDEQSRISFAIGGIWAFDVVWRRIIHNLSRAYASFQHTSPLFPFRLSIGRCLARVHAQEINFVCTLSHIPG